jgi:hypothetical protein
MDTYNSQDGRGTPNPVGKWEIVFDDSNPTDPTTVGLILGASNATITPLPNQSRPGKLVDGMLTDVVKAYDIQYKPGTTSWVLRVQMAIVQAKGINGARNIRVFAPGNSIDDPDSTDPFAPDANLVKWLQLDGGKAVEWVRPMDGMNYYGGVSTRSTPTTWCRRTTSRGMAGSASRGRRWPCRPGHAC